MIKVYLDFETYFADGYTIRSCETTMNYVRDHRFQETGLSIKYDDAPTQWFHYADIEDAMEELRERCEAEDVMIIAHNTKFDGLILTEKHGISPTLWGDTMAMARGLWPQAEANLAAIAKRIFPNDTSKRKLDDLKDVRGLRAEEITGELYERFAKYGVMDADLVYHCFNYMVEHLPEEEMYTIHVTTRMFCEPEIVLDESLMHQAIKEDEDAKRKKINDGIKLIIEKLGINYDADAKTLSSNKQFIALLEDLKVKVPQKISLKTGKLAPAFGKADVAFIKTQKDHPELKALWDARIEVKSTISGSRAKRLLAAAQGRPNDDKKLVVPLVYYGASTGRYAGNEKMNMQNLGRGSLHRLALTAGDGKLVYVEDSSNIEARVNAWFANDVVLLDLFASGGDVYSDMAEAIYGFPVSKKTHPFERGVGKVSVLGLGYNMGWAKFKDTLESGPMGMPPIPCTPEFAQHIVKTYRKKNKLIAQNWRRAQTFLEMMLDPDCYYQWGGITVLYQTLMLPNGMTLQYPNLTATEGEYGLQFEYLAFGASGYRMTKIYGGKLIENICQALARVVLNTQLCLIDKSLAKYNGSVVLQVHDEIVCIADAEPADEIMGEIRTIMRTSPDWAPNLPLDSEGGYDKCYSK